ncbi:MAG TPA: amino acid adenylation domain-containing protein, partial [Thermoanaerobaculia bacterium]|nr:amino acid adenylation domain-containing protein [Thermoanaerobaculia bacterium]
MAELVRQEAVPASVRTINLAGEPLRGVLARRIHELGTVGRLLNLYGPSEDTTYSTVAEVAAEGEPTIGRPLPSTRAYVVDARLHPLPVGVPGELLLAGRGLARGYLGRPELTAERFVPDPFAVEPGARLYRTGDLARWTPEGDLEFLGRLDHQVKVRGFRIELGEIETVLQAHPAVRESVVVARESEGAGAEARDLRLVAYVVLRQPEALPAFPAELRTHVSERLPEYMVPAAWVALAALPRTPNGKVDRRALPAPAPGGARPDRRTLPRTPEEELLAVLWADLLRVERVGVDDNFFDLGGHSLLATRVVSRVRETFGVEIPLRQFFNGPTVAALAQAIVVARRDEDDRRDGGLALRPGPRDGALPLSFAQERMWFLDRLTEGGALYNVPLAVRLSGALDGAALTAAFGEIARRHEVLRSRFVEQRGRPVLGIAPPSGLSPAWIDLAALPSAERRRVVAHEIAKAEARRPFDLATGPLVRVVVARLEAEEHLLVVTFHHIVADGWSAGVLIRELAALYAAATQDRPSPLPELPIQYADYARWQREWLAGGALASQLAWWRERLAGIPAVLDLPTDRPRGGLRTRRGGVVSSPLSPELTAGLRALGRRTGTTLFMTLLAGFQALLARYTEGGEAPVGSPIAGRTHVETEGLIGFFVNTLVLRTDLEGNPPFEELLARVRGVTLGAFDHQDVPFERLVEELAPQRSFDHSPLFQVMLALQNAPQGSLELPGLRLEPADVETGAVQFDLSLSLLEQGEGLAAWLEYDLDLFDAATAGRIAGHFRTLLAEAVERPGSCLSELPLLTPEENRQLAAWGRTVAVDGPCYVHARFEARAAEAPGDLAVLAAEERLTYGDLDARANRLARHLRRLGVGPEVPVAHCLPRSPDGVVGLLAILKSGGVYVPLDPANPWERRAFILADSGARVLVTCDEMRRDLPALPGLLVVCLDVEEAAGAEESGGRLEASPPESLAYVVYTSGSTGAPRGVGVEHRQAARHLATLASVYGLGPGDRLLQTAAWSFDMSVEQILLPLEAGAAVVLLDDRLDPRSLLRRVADLGVTVLDLATAFLQAWMREAAGQSASGLRLRLVSGGGEAMPKEIARLWPATPMGESRLVNGYGPTETVVTATLFDGAVTQPQFPAATVPIGRPLPGRTAHVLDRHGRPVPLGVPGELALGGVLARGYLGRPDVTAARFVPDPFGGEPGLRLYLTGDRVRWLPSGDLEFLGRLDHQVKIRGFRIEPGEIEAALASHPAVSQAAVVVQAEEEPRLVAFLVAAPGAAVPPDLAEVRSFLGRRLPEPMV